MKIMNNFALRILLVVATATLFIAGCATSSNPSLTKARSLEIDARDALNTMYASTPSSKVLADKAVAVLVFPSITKGGLMIGGQYGEGVLFKNGRVAGYYDSVAASYGFQAGIQKFGYSLIFMKKEDLAYLDKSDGWEIGIGPTITVVDVGMANSFTTTTVKDGVYAFFFGQRGLMAGLGVQGSKISRIYPN
jgi:lipid-binding SYLF domain-containing protein